MRTASQPMKPSHGHGLRFPLCRPKLPCVNDEQQARYSLHILLPGIGEPGQQRLLRSRALVIGLGGLGSPAAMYLASSGVGELVLSDYDYVELSNLQRQIIHTSADVGRDKVESARRYHRPPESRGLGGSACPCPRR